MNIQVNPGRTRGGGAWSGNGVARAASSAAAAREQIKAMAHVIGADDYLVLRVGSLGGRSGSHVTAVLDSGETEEEGFDPLVSRLAPAVLAHMENSLMPLVLATSPLPSPLRHCTAAMPAGVVLREPDVIAFPVKLGGLGNGLLMFFGSRLDLNGERVLDLHRRSYKVLKMLLVMDLKKSAPRQNLNDRELECLQLAGEGLKSERIAKRLSLSVHTVNAYLGAATAKLDSVNRIQAIAKAIRLGYLA